MISARRNPRSEKYRHKSAFSERARKLTIFAGSILLLIYVLAPVAWLVSYCSITLNPP